MKRQTVEQLLALNRQFYAAFAAPFAATRQSPQPGYSRLLEALPADRNDLLDVGCGEGRFGRYLQAQGRLAGYVGVDFTAALLAVAAGTVPGRVVQRDLTRADALSGLGQFEVVACLSTLQHIPGLENRVRLLREMRERLRPGGRVFMANWQFLASSRQRRKIAPWSKVDLAEDDVEPGDYLLTWQGGGLGYRYVRQIDLEETERLAAAAGLRVDHHFRSDGKEGDLNLYTILTQRSRMAQTTTSVD